MRCKVSEFCVLPLISVMTPRKALYFHDMDRLVAKPTPILNPSPDN